METLSVVRSFDLNLIRVLDAVISAGNATRASKRLNITPAAVSLALQRLQNTYNEALFIRTKEGLIPTARAKEIHHTFSHILSLVDTTFHHSEQSGLQRQIIISGSDIVEQYYFSQIFSDEIFDKYQIKYLSNQNIGICTSRELLLSGKVDLMLTLEPPLDTDLQQVMVERFQDYCIVCSQHNPLAEFEKVSLHSFYSFSHATLSRDMFNPVMPSGRNVIFSDFPYIGRRKIGYSTKSFNSLLSMVEHTSLIAILPMRLVQFFLSRMHYRLMMMALPDEIKVTPLTLYAVWSQNNKMEREIVTMVSRMKSINSLQKLYQM